MMFVGLGIALNLRREGLPRFSFLQRADGLLLRRLGPWDGIAND